MPGRYLFVTFLVTREGERGHPLDTIVERVGLDDNGQADPADLARLADSIAAEVTRKDAIPRAD